MKVSTHVFVCYLFLLQLMVLNISNT